jgi:hypothetical protein
VESDKAPYAKYVKEAFVKRLSTGVLAAIIAAGCALNAVAAPTNAQLQRNAGQAVVAQASDQAPAANFGTPPSGSIPILYNDHHVYAKPDTLKQGRVLAALVRNGTVLIPLRSMFEQMGASVSYDAGSKTVTVSKPGAEVKVTVGKPEVVINGESRPLDVPPIIYKGSVLVPVRVISEGMGAYVQWVPDQRVVVVRYLPPTPPPPPSTPAPTAPPTVAPTPTPVPVKPYHDLYIAGDYIFSPKVYNQFNPGNTGSGTNSNNYAVHGAVEFDLLDLPWMVEGDFQRFSYPGCGGNGNPAGCPAGTVETIGQGFDSRVVGGFNAVESDVDARVGIRVAQPRIYIGVGYLWRWNNYGYPEQNALGFGAEKLPDLDHNLSVFGGAWYYPNVKGGFTDPSTLVQYELAYNVLKYDAGIDWSPSEKFPIFIEAGWRGESGTVKNNAPGAYTINGPFAGLGIKF